MAEKKKNTDRALFEEGGGRSKSKGDISPVFSTDGDVTWDDTSLGLGELFVGDYTVPEESEVPPKREPATKIPRSYGWSATPNTESDEETKNDGTIAGESKNVGDKKTVDLLEKLLGGPDPYGAKPSGFGEPPVPEPEGDTTVTEKEPEEQIGTGVTDAEVNGYIEALRGILDPNYAARASEDVMGQYAAMTGGRPSSAAISAGTAARADAEATLLRELLSGGDTQNGESGGLLSGLLGEDDTGGDDVYADWAAPLLEGKEGLFNEQERNLLVSYMPALVKELEAEYPSDYAYRIYYLIQSMFDNGNITESTYNSLLRQTGLDGFIG